MAATALYCISTRRTLRPVVEEIVEALVVPRGSRAACGSRMEWLHRPWIASEGGRRAQALGHSARLPAVEAGVP
jgi:hypothetical protein